MALPGFNAEASVYPTFGHYYATGAPRGTNAPTNIAVGASGPIALAADECGCGRLRGCAGERCACECDGGYIEEDPHARCGFYCW
jgi:hypothetical protein